MALIEHYKGFQIWESDRHGKAVKGNKVTNSIQIRDYKNVGKGAYFLLKQISFKLGEWKNRNKAILKARSIIDDGLSHLADSFSNSESTKQQTKESEACES